MTEISLRDGARLIVRPIGPDDKERLRAGWRRLSEESRYRRLFTPMPELSDRRLEYLTEIDHHDHEALGALDAETGEGVAVARYVRGADPDSAEVAVTVADEWQGRGVGTALLELLAGRAREEGVRRFTATVLAENQEALDLLKPLSGVEEEHRQGGLVEITYELPENGDIREQIRRLVRLAAAMPLSLRRTAEPGS